MMLLSALLGDVETVSITGAPAGGEIVSLTFDSRTAAPGALFFAVPGTHADGHAFIGKAVAQGAAAVVCEILPENPDPSVTWVQVADSASALGVVAANFYGRPSEKLRLVGVTGTNGKTTTATLLYDLFRKLGYKAGLISTVVYRIDERREDSTHTTPDPLRINALLAEMADAGCEYCFMEVSSHALIQRRIAGLVFAGGIFTNITHDHLDYHKTFAGYIGAKKSFFDDLPADAFALVNADDRNGSVMVQNTRAKVFGYALRSPADFRGRIIEMHVEGMLLKLDDREVWVKFPGRFNAYNLACVYAAARLLDAGQDEALCVLSELGAVDGRFQTIRGADGVTAIVDYAHTPDALRSVIDTINEIRTPDQRLYVVVGCGGNRDTAKRPLMARIAAEGGDMAVLTSDNPRLEDPEAIIGAMKAGLDPAARYVAITNRREAIRAAVAMARPGDIVLVAGKGHETYQDAGGIKTHFDDREELQKAMNPIKLS